MRLVPNNNPFFRKSSSPDLLSYTYHPGAPGAAPEQRNVRNVEHLVHPWSGVEHNRAHQVDRLAGNSHLVESDRPPRRATESESLRPADAKVARFTTTQEEADLFQRIVGFVFGR